MKSHHFNYHSYPLLSLPYVKMWFLILRCYPSWEFPSRGFYVRCSLRLTHFFMSTYLVFKHDNCIKQTWYLCIYNVSYAVWSSSYAFWPHYFNKRGYNNECLYTLSDDCRSSFVKLKYFIIGRGLYMNCLYREATICWDWCPKSCGFVVCNCIYYANILFI